MNLIQALKSGSMVRRPIAKHLGATQSGWLSKDWVILYLTSFDNPFSDFHSARMIEQADLLADDWQAKS